MDNEIKLLPSSRAKKDTKTLFRELLFRLNMFLTRAFLRRARFYGCFLLEFIVFSFLSSSVIVINPYISDALFGYDDTLLIVAFLFLITIYVLSGLSVLGIASSVIGNAFFSYFLGILCSLLIENTDMTKSLVLILHISFLVLCVTIISVEIFTTSLYVLKGKMAVNKTRDIVPYYLIVCFFSFLAFILLLFLLKYN